ncbi:MAG: YciI family protein [Acidobacteriota bacterium]|nr:YciI family protein [Acidobacteriota bacterium]
MQYLLLIYGNEKNWAATPQDKRKEVLGEYFAFINDIKPKGHYIGGNPLQPTHAATTVRVRDGKRTVTDGPFAETKEQLGGYFLVEAKDLDEATEIAALIPGAKMGSIEVRPIHPIGPPPA